MKTNLIKDLLNRYLPDVGSTFFQNFVVGFKIFTGVHVLLVYFFLNQCVEFFNNSSRNIATIIGLIFVDRVPQCAFIGSRYRRTDWNVANTVSLTNLFSRCVWFQ